MPADVPQLPSAKRRPESLPSESQASDALDGVQHELQGRLESEISLMIFYYFHKWTRIKMSLKDLWSSYACGLLTLINAALTTNVAIEMFNRLENNIFETFSRRKSDAEINDAILRGFLSHPKTPIQASDGDTLTMKELVEEVLPDSFLSYITLQKLRLALRHLKSGSAHVRHVFVCLHTRPAPGRIQSLRFLRQACRRGASLHCRQALRLD